MPSSEQTVYTIGANNDPYIKERRVPINHPDLKYCDHSGFHGCTNFTHVKVKLCDVCAPPGCRFMRYQNKTP